MNIYFKSKQFISLCNERTFVFRIALMTWQLYSITGNHLLSFWIRIFPHFFSHFKPRNDFLDRIRPPHLSTKNIFIIQGYLSPRTERKQVKFEHKQHIPRNVRKNEWLVLFPLLLRYSYFNSKQVINFPAKSFPHSS